MRRKVLLTIVAGLFSSSALADEGAFTTGPVFDDFGPTAAIETDYAIPAGAEFKVSFDTRAQAEAGDLNRTLVSAARFINMHARAGTPTDNINLAVVIHGGAVKDVTNDDFYGDAVEGENANAPLIEALLEKGVKIVVCGQSAAYYDVGNENLLPGVQMALSAMTAHALLQQEGYTLNPF